MKKILFSLSLVFVFTVSLFASNCEKKCCYIMQNEPDEILMFLGLTNGNCEQMQQKDCKECNYKFVRSLSEIQLAQVNKIKETSEANKEFIADKIKTKKENLDKELSKKNYSKKNVKKLIKEIKQLSNEKITISLSERQQLRNILKTQQYKDMLAKPGKYDKFAQKLELTKEQQEKIESLFEGNKERIIVIKKEIAEKKLALEKEFFKENVNFDIINDISSKIMSLSNDMFKIVVDTKIELKKTLDNAQFNKLKSDLQISNEESTATSEIVGEEKQEENKEIKEGVSKEVVKK